MVFRWQSSESFSPQWRSADSNPRLTEGWRALDRCHASGVTFTALVRLLSETMELALNLTWLLIAVATAVAFGVWSARLPDDARARRVRWSVGLALVCVVALLFPIISVTDDLAPDASALEEWSATRRVAFSISNAQHAVMLTTTVVVELLLPHTGPIALACVGLTVIPVLTVLSPSTTIVWSFRGPPFACL